MEGRGHGPGWFECMLRNDLVQPGSTGGCMKQEGLLNCFLLFLEVGDCFLLYLGPLSITQNFGPHDMRCGGEGQHPGSSSSTQRVLHKLDGPLLKPCYWQGHAVATLGFPKQNLSKTIDIQCQWRPEPSPCCCQKKL